MLALSSLYTTFTSEIMMQFYNYFIFNRPGVAGAVLQTASSLIKWVSQSSFSSRYSQHHDSQTVRARELKFWENVHPTPCVMCHLSHVTCHISPVTCHLSPAKCPKNLYFFHTKKKIVFFNLVQKNGQSGVASRWRVCYQQGLPRLFFWRYLPQHIYNKTALILQSIPD